MRKKFTLLYGELEQLQNAKSPEELVDVWAELGAKLGFDPTSFSLIPGSKTFTADEIEHTVGIGNEEKVEIQIDTAEEEALAISALSDVISNMVHFAIASDALSVRGALSALTSAFAEMIIKTSPPDRLIDNMDNVLALVRNMAVNHASGKCSCGADHSPDDHDHA